jgi:hypothetical protein
VFTYQSFQSEFSSLSNQVPLKIIFNASIFETLSLGLKVGFLAIYHNSKAFSAYLQPQFQGFKSSKIHSHFSSTVFQDNFIITFNISFLEISSHRLYLETSEELSFITHNFASLFALSTSLAFAKLI